MDWDQLCWFDLRDGCPGCFFEQFRRRVRNLKSLRFGFIKGERKYSHRPMTCGETSAAVCNFLDSINGLDELYITNFESDTGYLVSSILKYSSTLRTLKFYDPLEGICGRVIAPIWPTEVLEQLQEQCTNLSHLGIDVSLVNNELVKSLLHLRLKKILTHTVPLLHLTAPCKICQLQLCADHESIYRNLIRGQPPFRRTQLPCFGEPAPSS